MYVIYAVFIKYMYTCMKPFPNFQKLNGVNRVDIFDVTFTGREGGGGGGSKKVKSVVTSLMDSALNKNLQT